MKDTAQNTHILFRHLYFGEDTESLFQLICFSVLLMPCEDLSINYI